MLSCQCPDRCGFCHPGFAQYSAIAILQFNTKALHSNIVQKEANETGINQASGLQQENEVLARSQGMLCLAEHRYRLLSHFCLSTVLCCHPMASHKAARMELEKAHSMRCL